MFCNVGIVLTGVQNSRVFLRCSFPMQDSNLMSLHHQFLSSMSFSFWVLWKMEKGILENDICWCVWVGNWCVGACGLVTGVLVCVGW